MAENIDQILMENENLKQENSSLKTILAEREAEINLLKEAIRLSREKLFGSSSEKTPDGQLSLGFFDEAEKESNLKAEEPTVERVTKKKRTSRTENLSHLETEVTEYTLPEDKLLCPKCNTPLKKITVETRETIKLYKKVIRHLEKRAVYACPKCDLFVKADMPKLPIEGSLADASTLSQVIVDKFANHLPLYRQSQDFERIGLSLSRQNLSNWILKSSDLLDIVYQKMKNELLSKDILHADETTVQVLKESGKAAKSKSYMWLYQTGRYDTPIVIYDYHPSRSGKIPQAFLKDFSGYLHVDGYSGYNHMDNVTLVGCLAHVKRYFNDAYKLIENTEDAKQSNTAKGLAYCNKLFSLEKESKTLELKDRYIFKQEKIKPMFDEFLTWLNQASINALPQSKYGKAITYALNQMPNLMHYLDRAELDIDNNRAERSIKPFVTGRKNWLFNHSVDGAEASARLYSIVQTCMLNNVNPYNYLSDTLTKLANMTINQDTDIESLLPWKYQT
ncbi:MAG: IS66 family transposase [Candidatus Izemoplasmatales bacterium]|nr:IS66 family transposase [Candidatus Izemoplasmatales bacterium]